MRRALHTLGILALAARPLLAQDAPGFRLGGFMDLRAAASSPETGWLDGGLGKTRYGGQDGDRRYAFHVSQASLLVDAAASESLSLHVQANVDPESYARPGLSGVDLVEAWAAFRPALSRTLTAGFKVGVFFPPISLEHDGPAWSTTRTLTPSAINSWVGEEVRATGLEASLVVLLPSSDLTFSGAVFGWNDPDGALLAWRGWALGDRQTMLTDRLPLAALPELGPGGTFPLQDPWTAPFREVDGRAGWYAGARWEQPQGAEVRALWFDNGGDRTTVVDGQYSWQTHFGSAGVRVPLGSFELLAQGMDGRTRMGYGPAVDVTFRAAYALAALRLGTVRLAVRGDLFRNTDERAGSTGYDEYSEHGWALTGAATLALKEGIRVVLEVVRIDSTREVREDLGGEPRAVETTLQAAFRVRF